MVRSTQTPPNVEFTARWKYSGPHGLINMSKYIACALLAPTIANALYAIPQPTQNIPVLDAWSPAPTEAPLVPGYDLLNRQVRDSDRDSTCGFVSGSSGTHSSPLNHRRFIHILHMSNL